MPAAVAFGGRLFVKEPERWTRIAQNSAPPRLGELFSPQFRRITLSGFLMAVIALITWWSCNAFLPVFATGLAQTEAALRGLAKSTTLHLVEDWTFTATMVFKLGGLKSGGASCRERVCLEVEITGGGGKH